MRRAICLPAPGLAERHLPRAFALTTFITLTAAVFAILPNEDDDGNTVYGVLDQPARFWAIFGMTVAGIVLLRCCGIFSAKSAAGAVF